MHTKVYLAQTIVCGASTLQRARIADALVAFIKLGKLSDLSENVSRMIDT